MGDLSRRNFIKAAAFGMAGATGGTLLSGCASQAKGSAVGSDAAGVSYDEEFDIVVVGAGLAGATAALTAMKEGEDVSCLLLEKGGTPGGNSPVCDNAAIWTDEPDVLYNYLKDLSGEYAPNDDMIRAYAEGFGENIGWFKSLGVTEDLMKASMQEPSVLEYQEFGSDGGACGVVRLLDPSNTENSKYMHPFLLQQAQDNGAEYRTDSPAEHLIKDDTGAVVGVVADGRNIKANKGVVLACGGFENNPEFLECYVQCGGALPAAATLNTGDGSKCVRRSGLVCGICLDGLVRG